MTCNEIKLRYFAGCLKLVWLSESKIDWYSSIYNFSIINVTFLKIVKLNC